MDGGALTTVAMEVYRIQGLLQGERFKLKLLLSMGQREDLTFDGYPNN